MRYRLKMLAVVSLLSLVPAAQAQAQEGGLGLAQTVAEEIGTPYGTAAPTSVVFPESYPERLYDFLDDYKQCYNLPVTLGAFNWEHVDAGGPLRTGYGIPPVQTGTYFYYLLFDPSMNVDWGPITKIGYHGQLRWRDAGLFRNFYPSDIWPWENYLWADTPWGKFKVGQIWKRFGTDWDTGTFWGNVQYFDGFKLNPDYGIAWENTWKVRPDFKVDTLAQFFLTQDGVNGTVDGADSESLPGSTRRNNGVVRVVPTWTFADESTLALGFSGSLGEIVNKPVVGFPSQQLGAIAFDATYTKGHFQAIGEIDQAWGVSNPQFYVTGGPSNRMTDALVGISYTLGPVKFQIDYSAGFYVDPSGWQSLLVPGVVVALTKNIDFYAEYVRWDVFAAETHTVFEDGWQFVINWRF